MVIHDASCDLLMDFTISGISEYFQFTQFQCSEDTNKYNEYIYYSLSRREQN